MNRVALFGGAFNPPHRAHAAVARACLAQLPIDRLIVLPAGRHPWKEDDPALAPGPVRLQLCRLAFAFDPRIEVSDYEVAKSGPAYTVDTLRHFAQALGPAAKLYWVIGADNLAQIHLWREPQAIFQLAELVVLPRPGHATVAAGLTPRVLQLAADPVTATDLRRRLARGEELGDELDPGVRRRIGELGLYRS